MSAEPILHNLITDVPGVRVGNAHEARLASGVTAIMVERPNVASGVVLGGAPGGRDLGLLEPEMTVDGVDAVVFAGGSVFGLDAAGGVASHLRGRDIGLAVAGITVPIAIQAIIFDLANGGDKNWGERPPYWEMGRQGALAASAGPFALGTIGAGFGATTASLKGGLGSASARTPSGHVIGALAVVNALGAATVGDGPWFWAAPYERGAEFGGYGLPPAFSEEMRAMRIKIRPTPATTIACIATDAILTKAQAKRLAIMANDGLARAIRPAHAPMDGDTVIALATGRRPLDDPTASLTMLGHCAADCLARAVARGVYEATALPFPGTPPAWRDRYAPKRAIE